MPELDSTIINEAAAHYGAAQSPLTPLAGGHATAVFEFTRTEAPYVLRIIPPSDETRPEDVQAIQTWVSFLAARGAPVPAPLIADNGQPTVIIDRPEGPYSAVGSEKAQGILAETLPQSSWNSTYFYNLGKTAARLHNLAMNYTPPENLRRPDFLSLGDLFSPDQPASPVVTSRKRTVLATLQKLPRSTEHFGMIHGDFHFGNFFVDPDDNYAVTVFDFDDCGYGWYVMDTATLLFDIAVLYDGDDVDGFAKQFLKYYLRGYQSERALEPVWLAQLPHFLKLLEISYYALLAPIYEPGNQDDFWVAKFMPGRQTRVENDVPYLELDFAALLDDLR